MTASGAVAAGHEVTAGVAAEILRAGGNAYDAVIAALWAACIAEPVLASPAGGGFVLARPADGAPELYDFFVSTLQSRAPDSAIDFRAVHADFGTTTQEFHIGAAAAAAPGFVPGLFAVHDELASMDMADLIAPAVQLARAGIMITPFQAKVFEILQPILTDEAASRALFAPEGDVLGAGAHFQNRDLADTLEEIATSGAAAMGEGALGEAIADRVGARGGHLTRADLVSYEVARRTPLAGTIGDAHVWTNPPPAAGGVMVLMILAAMAGQHGTLALAQAIDQADRTRRGEAATSDAFTSHPQLLAAFEEIAATPARRGTTHVSVIDANGNAAAATVTNGEGNGQMVGGFMLNNMLGEADLNPQGFGKWAEGVRLASMMAPTIVELDEEIIALGSGGSNRIRSAIAAVTAHLIDGMRLEPAITSPRLHIEGGHLDFEDFFDAGDRTRLVELFADHLAWAERSVYFGGVHAVARHNDGTFEAAGDPRRDGVGMIVG